MRLIDADELLKEVQSQEMWNVPDFVYESIQTSPTISAIPTHFLYKWFGDNYNAYTDLIIEWKKENEID